MIKYSPHDLLSVLGVEPERMDEGVVERFRVERPPLLLEITVHPYDGTVEAALFLEAAERPTVRISLLESVHEIVRVCDPRSPEHLQFRANETTLGVFVDPELRITSLASSA